MSFLFWMTTIIAILISIYKVKINTENIYILIGVYLPLIMYFFRWSNFIDKNISNNFYYIFIIFNCILIIFEFFNIKNIKRKLNYKIKNKRLLIIINFFFIALYLLENYIGSGSFIPSIKGIDIHTFSASGIAYFTRNLYCIMCIDLLFFLKTKEKKYIIILVIIFLLPILTRSARMVIVIAALKVGLLGLFLYKLKRKINNLLLIKIGIVTLIIIGFLTGFTNYRMNKNSDNNYKYEQLIHYTGPKFLSNILSVYYGYFPLSYDNLNINIKRVDNSNLSNNKTYGLYTFKGLFFSVFQLHRVANIDPNYVYNNVIYNTGAAIVPTMFYEMYYDYGYLIFIPIIIFLLITIFLRINKQKSILFASYYYFYVPSWCLAAFQNTLASATVVWGIVLLTILIKIFIVE